MTMRPRYLSATNLSKTVIILLHFAILKAFFISRVTLAQDLFASIASSPIFITVMTALTVVFHNRFVIGANLLLITYREVCRCRLMCNGCKKDYPKVYLVSGLAQSSVALTFPRSPFV